MPCAPPPPPTAPPTLGPWVPPLSVRTRSLQLERNSGLRRHFLACAPSLLFSFVVLVWERWVEPVGGGEGGGSLGRVAAGGRGCAARLTVLATEGGAPAPHGATATAPIPLLRIPGVRQRRRGRDGLPRHQRTRAASATSGVAAPRGERRVPPSRAVALRDWRGLARPCQSSGSRSRRPVRARAVGTRGGVYRCWTGRVGPLRGSTGCCEPRGWVAPSAA